MDFSMLSLNDLKLNLGLPRLFGEWKKMFSLQNLAADSFAGITVAFVAIPLSLAIALASGASPATGLVTAIIAGIVCAFFGGTPLAVSGPAAAMSVLILEIVQKFGLSSLILIGCLAGAMQLLSGMLGLGRLSRLVPLPVVAGFTAGIGVIIIVGQLPRALGVPPQPEVSLLYIFSHIKLYLHEINGACLLLVGMTFLVARVVNKVSPKLPAILFAVCIASFISYIFNLSVPLIGAIPSALPSPRLPELTHINPLELLFNAFIVYVLASLETLLSSSAVDKLAKGPKHDPDQELIGQGLGNIAVSIFGGMPITGVIARSAINVRAGAKTRRASIIHSLLILASITLIAPVISQIPIAVLSGVLFYVAISMVNVKEFMNLWKTARSDALIYIVTFCTIIFVDLLAGIQTGVIAAYIIVLYRATKTHLHISSATDEGITRVNLVGALNFLSTGKLNRLQNQLIQAKQTIVMDLTNIRNVDVSGAQTIVDFYHQCSQHGIYFYIKGLPRRFELIFRACDGSELLDEHYLISDHQLRKHEAHAVKKSSYGRLVHGIYQFYIERKHNDKRLFEFMSQGQDPHTLFITCSDSRVVPSMITSADPGELFIVRNIGNYVPPYHEDSQSSESAALQFALSSFDITDIVVCGHANCGAINACKNIEMIQSQPLKNWITKINSQLDQNVHELNDQVRFNILNQLKNLLTYPIVQEKLANKTLSIHGWFYNFNESLVYEWKHNENSFRSILPKAEAHAV
jgi:carbonic anhydrase